MKKRGTRGIATIMVAVLAIATLVVGLIVGMVVEGNTRILYPVEEPTELQDRIDELEAEVDDLEDTIDDLDDTLELVTPYLVAEAEYIANSLNVTFPMTTLTGEIELGAILSLTGDLATFGENEKIAAEFAAEQVNVLLEELGADWTLTIVPEDTQTKPDICLEKVESLAARGIELIIGPLSSAEVRNIKTYCDNNKILAISQSSTAPDLAIADDYILRFCPTDKLGQGPAIARIMYDDGKRYIIPVTRNDAWGKGLQDATEDRFNDPDLNGTFLDGVLYDPEATEFSTEAASLRTKVSDAIAAYGADEVAVLHISFEEVTGFMTACAEYDELDDVVWYGSDGTCTSGAMLENPAVRDFAMSVEYLCTIFGPAPIGTKWGMVRQRGLDVLGREPESYSYAIYDIVWAYAYALLIVDEYDAEAIKDVIPDIVAVEAYIGASGKVTLDEFGDREAGDYDIWQITEIATDEYDWKAIGSWVMATDSVVWK
ncbi:MAG: ABC transporter substrate-binding protein [Candidatus Bathyarchaeota archaeon]|nr:MAG: ABC transporter substrate-binding protein [Candidatus Bathyarchaeota archaeon]